MNKTIYVDNAATTPVSDTAFNAMLPFLRERYGNPSSLYSVGRDAKEALEDARATVAGCLNADKREIFFTSCGSEADNWAIKSTAHMMAKKGKRHIITTAFEHHAVLYSAEALKKEGFEITFLDVHEDGVVRPEEVEAAIREDTALVSIMYANNEIGTVQPIPEIGAICKAHGVLFHTDAVQAVGNVHIDVKAQNIDMLSLSGHKFHAPKGVGVLYVRRGINLPNFMDGGAQESNRRAGTENVAGIAALAAAMKEACDTIDIRAERMSKMRDRLIDTILAGVERSRCNGSRKHRLPGNVSFCFEGIEGESLLLMLDMKGVCASSGSACTSGSLDPSHVLLAIGLPHEIAHGSLRISFGDQNTEEDVDYILEVLPPIVERLRAMSPLWEHILEKAAKEGDK